MKQQLNLAILVIGAVLAGGAHKMHAADEPPEFVAAAMKRRSEISLGGDFKPDPRSPVFVAVGHGGRILLSRDDGQTWKQVFWGHPGSDHGPWATKAIAYTNGVFVVPIGWGAPTAWLASEDGVNWRHLTSGQTKLKGIKEADGDPTVMPGTWGIAGGKGVFVTGGYMQMAATPDLGKTITTFSLYDFKNDPRPRKLVTHHVGPVYCGDASGRFLALGNDRSKENTVFGNLWASDDLGRTWTWLDSRRGAGSRSTHLGNVEAKDARARCSTLRVEFSDARLGESGYGGATSFLAGDDALCRWRRSPLRAWPRLHPLLRRARRDEDAA